MLRTDFDRSSDNKEGFRHHIKINHYMWAYFYFIAYLRWKKETQYNGIESYVIRKLE